jgi:hypothetical protein
VPPPPPERIIGQMSREFRLLLEEDFDPDDIRAGLATWMSKDVAPSVLPSMVNQIVNAKPKAADRAHAGRGAALLRLALHA